MAAGGGPWTIVRVGPLVAPDGIDVGIDDGPTAMTLRLVARTDLDGIASGRFSRPSAAVRIELDGEPTYLGFSATQFAMPLIAGPGLDFDFRPAPNLHSPPVLGVLIARTAGAEGVPAGSRPRWACSAPTLDPLLRRWGDAMRAGRPRRPVSDNPLTSHLSYWSDNGAAYWYRTEPGRTNGGRVADAVESLREAGIPIGAVELDSWCYDHEVARPIAEIGYPEEVPPTGMLTWTPRRDAFDTPVTDDDAIEAFAARLGHPPLIVHARHISPASPYLAEGDWWVDVLAAHPVDRLAAALGLRVFKDCLFSARPPTACAGSATWLVERR